MAPSRSHTSLGALAMLALSVSSIMAAPNAAPDAAWWDRGPRRARVWTFTISRNQPVPTVTTTTVSLSIPETQTASTSVEPSTVGTINTELPTGGGLTTVPFPTSLPVSTTNSISAITTGTAVINSTEAVATTALATGNIFRAMATDSPLAQLGVRSDHPVPLQGIDQTTPIETNKFYSNFFLGSRSNPTWTQPYSLSWSKGGGSTSSWGMSISHIEARQRVFGPSGGPGGAANYFVNPLGIQSIVLSAAELGPSTALTMDSLQGFSANVNLAPNAGDRPVITFPVVQGMGMVTGVYNGATPLIQSGVFFQSLTFVGPVNSGATVKYRLALDDGTTWLLYATAAAGTDIPQFSLSDSQNIRGTSGYFGSIQIAKNSAGGNGENTYDTSAGVYAVAGALSASVNGASGTYTLSWQKGGDTSRPLLMFALPHHVQSLSGSTSRGLTAIQLDTTTKGVATAVLADSWDLVENLPVTMGFAPWRPSTGSVTSLSQTARDAVNSAGAMELAQDMNAQTNLNSMYYSGKALGKFASAVYAVNDLGRNTGVASAGLLKLKDAFARFVNNRQQIPLVYDSVWKGLVSDASYGGNFGADFGNTYYNDHQFHYGYFVYAAAVIGYLDPSWLNEGTNKAWVNMLVRDFVNPVSDEYYPFSRSFDWYNGHSWAKGLFESGDGKDLESTSEDGFASYALKMWGSTVGDENLEARGNLMLAIQARSFSNYFYYQSNNYVQPSNFIGNKVAGILFENKIDHTTYFGNAPELVEGIHMLPLNPSSTLTRSEQFVREEWDTYFSNGRADSAPGGWRGILYANLAIIDPVAAYRFFSQPNFDMGWLDGGASLTWYLAWSAALGGA